RLAQDAAARDAARRRRLLVRSVRAFDARQAVGLVLRRQRIAAIDRVLSRRAVVVEAVVLALLLGGAGFLQAGRAVFGGATGGAGGAVRRAGRLVRCLCRVRSVRG